MKAPERKPLFSICHTSARPEKWRAVYDDWMNKAVHPEQVEYVLCVDPRWGFSLNPNDYDTPLDNIHVVVNTKRRCYVDGVNLAAEGSTGDILIVNADDQFAFNKWDEALTALVAAEGVVHSCRVEQFVLEPNTGTPDEHARGIMVMPILSRARYEKLGYVFYPEYESMCADNDFFAHAYQDGVVIDARHVGVFPHRHPLYDSEGRWRRPVEIESEWDAQYQAQNDPRASVAGMKLFKRRQASKFAKLTRRSIALCLTGELFQGVYLDFILALQAHLLIDLDFEVIPFRSYTSNPYITREDLRRALANLPVKPELCLWIDDDNPLSIAHFDRLLTDIDAHPEVDGMAGWCWIHSPEKTGFTVSCGLWAADHLHWEPFPSSFANSQDIRSFECGGLPCILMRYSALEKAGDGAFLPIVDNRLEHGVLGEDFAFFLAAEKGGATFLVDPVVRVPHLKYVEVEPVFESDGKTPVKVACMMRVKNEARWIQRTIDSVRDLCGDLIFVMEDGSTDNTREICEAAGCVVLPSPFVGMGLDEGRDKDWLLQEVIARCKPDWILMPDGDEELEPGGCDKIRRALAQNPPVDCFAMGFFYCWDEVNQIRVDGNYGTLARQSLFRADTSFRFKSYYSEHQTKNQNHVGLHTSNAPGLGGKCARINVGLFHYGYLHAEDRIRKFEWITRLDPNNVEEGFYLHCVQGDLTEVPIDAKLKHGGPLKLITLPARLVPQFDQVPGPLALGSVYQETLARAMEYAGEKMRAGSDGGRRRESLEVPALPAESPELTAAD